MLASRPLARPRVRLRARWVPSFDEVNAAFPPLGFLIAFAVCSAAVTIQHPELFAAIFQAA